MQTLDAAARRTSGIALTASIDTSSRTLALAPGSTGAIVPALDACPPDILVASYAECARITQSRARNFYYGLRLTPKPRRSAIYSIYAWMRTADDLADAPGELPDRRAALADFRTRTLDILHGSPPAVLAGIWPAFAATARSYPIDPVIFADMLDGLEADLAGFDFETDQDLSQYCYRVAGTAGLACLWIWGLRDGASPDAARELALRRGQAFQRTNILRDLAEDLDESPRRVYIPSDAFRRHDLTPDTLRDWTPASRCAALIAEQAAIAREHYTASRSLESMIDPACSPTLWAMTRIYTGLLELIEADPSRVVGSRRIRLPGPKKAGIALSAAIWARVGRW